MCACVCMYHVLVFSFAIIIVVLYIIIILCIKFLLQFLHLVFMNYYNNNNYCPITCNYKEVNNKSSCSRWLIATTSDPMFWGY